MKKFEGVVIIYNDLSLLGSVEEENEEVGHLRGDTNGVDGHDKDAVVRVKCTVERPEARA